MALEDLREGRCISTTGQSIDTYMSSQSPHWQQEREHCWERQLLQPVVKTDACSL